MLSCVSHEQHSGGTKAKCYILVQEQNMTHIFNAPNNLCMHLTS